MGSIYVGSSLFNARRVRDIQARFIAAGMTISYNWTEHGQVFSPAELAAYGDLEEKGIINCDLFFMIFPARNGTHCELGMARVLFKHIVMLEDEPPPEQKTFYYRPVDHPRPIYRFTDENEAIAHAIRLLQEQ